MTKKIRKNFSKKLKKKKKILEISISIFEKLRNLSDFPIFPICASQN